MLGPQDIRRFKRVELCTDPVEVRHQFRGCFYLHFAWGKGHRVKSLWPVLGIKGLCISEEVPCHILHQETLRLALKVNLSLSFDKIHDDLL